MSADTEVTPAWLSAANRIPLARAIAIGALSFLVAHGVAAQEFDQAAKRGDTVSTVFSKLDQVGQQLQSDRLDGRVDDLKVVHFWQDEIRRAAGKAPHAS